MLQDLRESLIDFFMDAPWSASMAVLRVLQMCEEDDLNILQMPKTCPWCSSCFEAGRHVVVHADLHLLGTRQDWQRLYNTYTGILEGSEVNRQAFPNVRELLSVKDKKAIKDFESPGNHRLHLWKGTSSVAISGRNNDGVHCQGASGRQERSSFAN